MVQKRYVSKKNILKKKYLFFKMSFYINIVYKNIMCGVGLKVFTMQLTFIMFTNNFLVQQVALFCCLIITLSSKRARMF